MATPARLQLSRRKGFNLQDSSRAVNGLPAVNVARGPGRKWGNPYRVGHWIGTMGDGPDIEAATPEQCVAFYRRYMDDVMANPGHAATRAALAGLRGKNLACWCKPGEPCHADVLLELANRPVCEEVTP